MIKYKTILKESHRHGNHAEALRAVKEHAPYELHGQGDLSRAGLHRASLNLKARMRD
jgi:uncharacterized protein (UPF0276 family)